MGDATKAVFLSYASQDAEAAKRICDALRAAGLEVWFDQSELRGGDSWDAKIRRQIKECALFVPIISANTNARPEGYFRLEWKLAVDRSHLLADDHPFLFPVVIDESPDALARVPDKFRDVQWTRLNVKDTPETLALRVGKLLGGDSRAPAAAGSAAPRFPGKSHWMRNLGMIMGLTIGLVYALRPLWSPARRPESKPAAVTPAPGEHQPSRDWPKDPELKRAMRLLDRLDAIPGDFKLAEDMAGKALDRAAMDPEAATAMARVQSMWLLRGWDQSEDRFLKAKTVTERAVQLAPDEPEALGALGIYLYMRGGEEGRAREALEQAIRLEPGEPRFHRARDGLLFFLRGVTVEEAFASSRHTVELFPRDALVHYELGRHYRNAGLWTEFERENDAALALAPVANALVWKARAEFALRGDLPAMKAALDLVPARVRATERTVLGYFTYAALSGHPAEGLDMLQTMPDAWLVDFDYVGPKALLTGILLELQGKPALARLQYEAALAEVQRRKALEPTNAELLKDEAWVLHSLGREAEARAAARVALEAIPRPYRMNPLTSWWFQPVPLYLLLGEKSLALQLLRETTGQTDDAAAPPPVRITGADLLREAAGRPQTRNVIRQSLRLDPRMAPFRDDAEIQALLAEPVKAEDRGQRTEGSVLIDQKSIAVLAFANLSDDKANEYFSDGISEELLNVLAKVPGLKVTARTSSFHFKGMNTAIPEIASQLGVAYVVEGSVRKSGDKVRITAQLIKAADGFHVWSDTFTRDLKDIFAVQDEIAGLIAQNLKLKLGMKPAARLVNPEAYALYLQAIQGWNQRVATAYQPGLVQAEATLQRAIALDPEFAPAYVLLSNVTYYLGSGFPAFAADGTMRPSLAAAIAQGQQAARLAPDSAEAHSALGLTLSQAYRDGEAEIEYRGAIAAAPSYAPARARYARLLEVEGRMDEALDQMRRAVELDPLYSRAFDNFALMLSHAGRREEALAAAERSVALAPENSQAMLYKTLLLLDLGRRAEADVAGLQAMASKFDAAKSPDVPGYLCAVLVGTGQQTEAETLYARIPAELPGERVYAAVVLGRLEEARKILASGWLPKDWMDEFLWNPMFDPLRDSAEYGAMLRRHGLVEAHARVQAWRAAHPPAKPEVKK